MRRLLIEMGFSYKKNNNRRGLCQLPHVKQKRVEFLRSFLLNELNKNNPDKEYYEPVYLDETWIFLYGNHIYSWIDESEFTVKHTKSGEGTRYIVLHAGDEEGWIDGCELIFKSKANSGDYHDEMNSDNFMRWVTEKLIPGLAKRGKKFLIVMDNAPYHGRTISKPISKMKVSELIDELNRCNIPIPPPAPGRKLPAKAVLKDLVKKLVPKRYEADQLLQAEGHKVLRLPPYHCQYSAVELAWADTKGFYNKHVGRDNGTDKR